MHEIVQISLKSSLIFLSLSVLLYDDIKGRIKDKHVIYSDLSFSTCNNKKSFTLDMVRASSLCFAILAVKMCMSKRFNKVPESPESMNIKTLWFEGVEDIIENDHLPDDFDKTQETDIVIHGYLVDTSLPEIRDLAFILKKVSFIFMKKIT